MTDQDGLKKRLDKNEARKTELEAMLVDPDIMSNPEKLTEISREHNRVLAISEKSGERNRLTAMIEEENEVIRESEDAELKELAKEELDAHVNSLESIEGELKKLLIPEDPSDRKNAIL